MDEINTAWTFYVIKIYVFASQFHQRFSISLIGTQINLFYSVGTTLSYSSGYLRVDLNWFIKIIIVLLETQDYVLCVTKKIKNFM